MSSARQARVVLLSGNSLSHNPRALKAAGALARAGHDVTVLGAWRDADLKAQDQCVLQNAPFRFVPVLDATQSNWRDTAAQFVRRARKSKWQGRRCRARKRIGTSLRQVAPGACLALARRLDSKTRFVGQQRGMERLMALPLGPNEAR